MMPYTIVETRPGSRAVLESTTPLPFGLAVSSDFIETVDFLGGRHNSHGLGGGFGGGAAYTYNPQSVDTRFFLDYCIYAEAAGGAIAPGGLTVLGQMLTPTDPATFLPERVIAHVTYSGDVLDWGASNSTFTRRARLLTGSIRIRARRFFVTYLNKANSAQTVFRIGVYLRAA